MTNQILAKRYAKALLTLGREDGNYRQYGEELSKFVAFWEQQPEFVDAVSNPLYVKDNRKVICQAVAAKLGLSQVFRSLLNLMIEKNRLRIVPDVRTYYQKLLDEMANTSRAEVASATTLAGEEVAAKAADGPPPSPQVDFAAFASRVDNRSNDPVYLPACGP